MKLKLSLILASVFGIISVEGFRLTGNEIQTFENVTNNEKIPIRYDKTQLWRIYKRTDQEGEAIILPEIVDAFELNFGGNLWRHNANSIDMSITKENLIKARKFLNARNIPSDILHDDIQKLIDQEKNIGIKAREKIRRKRQLNRSKKSINISGSGMHWNDYHDLKTIYRFMKELQEQFPNITRLYNIGTTADGNSLKVLRISENPREYEKIWIDGGIHAREWISPAVVTYIAYTLLSNWETQPPHIKTKTWYIMPLMNPDGYTYSREVNRLWRKNRSQVAARSSCFGTDLNRNFDIGWDGPGSSTNPCSDTFRGISRASELETKAVANFLTRRKTNLGSYLTFHSYGQMIVYPWAYKAETVKDFQQLQDAADEASKRAKEATRDRTKYLASTTHKLLGVAGGGSDDWSRYALNATFVYTIELRDRGIYGFVLPPDQIRNTAKEGYTIVDTITSYF